jgi:hypothetical protein
MKAQRKAGKPAPAAAKPLVPKLKKGRCGDGHPLDDLQYLESKLIL